MTTKTLNGLCYTNFQIFEGAGKVCGRVAFPIDLGGCTVELGAVFVYETRFQFAKDRVETYAEKAWASGRTCYSLRSALSKGVWVPKIFLEDAIEYSEYDYCYAFDPGEISGIHDFLDYPKETVNSTLEVIKADTKGYEYIVQNMLNDTIGDQTDKLLLHKVVTEIEQKGDQVYTNSEDKV